MRNLARGLRDAAIRGVGASALVLTYHRVAELATDPQLLAVTPEHFREQTEMLSQRFRVIGLGMLVEELCSRSLEPGTLAVTFDDGYADNLTNAAPVLEANAVPATIFVSSGCIESGREFWWDEVERLAIESEHVPGNIRVSAGGHEFAAEVGPADEAPDPHWDVLAPDSHPRHRLYREFSAFLRPLAAAERSSALDQFAWAVGVKRETRPGNRPLTTDEVAALDAVPGLEIGCHSRDHDVLALRSSAEQAEAITGDKATLEAWCGRSIDLFSYPFGGRADFTAETARIVADAGFTGATANHPGLVKPWTDRYRLPRQVVRDWDAETLDERINDWFGTGPGAR